MRLKISMVLFVEQYSVRHCARILSSIVVLNANNKNDIFCSILVSTDFDSEYYRICSRMNNGVAGSQPLCNSKDSQIVVATVVTSLF